MRVAVSTFLVTLVSLHAGCAGKPSSTTHHDVEAVSSALTIIECQTDAAECLGVLPSTGDVAACREAAVGCVGDAIADTGEQLAAVSECRSEALGCLSGAASYADATMCRADFETCITDVVDLPGLPAPPDLFIPPFSPPSGLPDPTNLFSGASDCRSTALMCALAADGDLVALGQCADDFTTCFGDLLMGDPAAPPPATGGEDEPPMDTDEDAGVADDEPPPADPADSDSDSDTETETETETEPAEGDDDMAASGDDADPQPVDDTDAPPTCAAEALTCLQSAAINPLAVTACGYEFKACVLVTPPQVTLLGDCLAGLSDCIGSGETPLACVARGQLCAATN